MENEYICQHCQSLRKNKNSLINHERTCPSNKNRVLPVNGMKGKKSSNQFIHAKKNGLPVPEAWNKGKKIKGTPHTAESKKHLSEIAYARGLGGHTSKKSIYYTKRNGDVVYLQSSYEQKFADILEDLGINWTRPAPLHWTSDDGKPHRYYPDFKIGDVYFDTKNDYLIKKDEEKINCVRSQNCVTIHVVGFENINTEYILRMLT